MFIFYKILQNTKNTDLLNSKYILAVLIDEI
jgi:hypothetical protein